MEATRASKAMKVAFRSNLHMDSRVIEVAGFKSVAIFIDLSLASLWGHCPLFLHSAPQLCFKFWADRCTHRIGMADGERGRKRSERGERGGGIV